jgi:FPC/CPF motif-containing protein YcgG
VGSRSVANRLTYRFGLYPVLGSADAAAAVCHDLYEFNHEFDRIGDEFVSFIAGFGVGGVDSEIAFERALWGHLQAMHEVDRRSFAWDPQVNSDPAHPEFSFSIGGRGFFVVGLHPHASRMARRTQQPTIVFNAHEQFEALRRRGKFEMMKQMIRARDLAYQGSINPVLENFGAASEARQYSGRAVPSDWDCPFHPKTRDD